MNKKVIAVCALSALSSAALAQSNVSVFGVLDLGLRHAKGGDRSLTSMASGGIAGSRLGFRGSEDLGGGYKANFWLEAAISPDTGTTNTKFWHRQATVGISGPFGQINLGRERTPTYLSDFSHDPFYDIGVANMSNISGVLAGSASIRTDNAISYRTPAGLGGFFAHVQVALGEGDPNNKYRGVRIGYASGPWSIDGAYAKTATVPVAYEQTTLGASYKLGKAKLVAHYSRKELGAVRYDHVLLGSAITVGAGTINVSAAVNRGRDAVDGRGAKQFGIGYVHNLSKRTALYTTAAYLDNKPGSTYRVVSAPAITPGGSSQGFELGIQHAF